MRQSALKMLRRWMALDRALRRGGVQLRKFANVLRVDVKTVRRDLAHFKRLGYAARWEPAEGEGGGPETCEWSYPMGQQPLFTASQPRPAKPRRPGGSQGRSDESGTGEAGGGLFAE